MALGAWVVLGLLLYAKTFHAPFLFDDEILIVHNPYVQDLAHGLDSLKNIYSYQHSRLLTNLSVALNFQWGRLDTFGYHVVNWLLHLLVTCGVWYLTRMIMAFKKIEASVDIAFWSSLLFLVHPLHTESVSYINHRSSLLVTLFYLWSLIFYLKARTASDPGKGWRFFTLAGISALLSLLSKESAWTLPLAWIMGDMLLLNRSPKRSLWVSLVVIGGILAAIFDFKIKSLLMTAVYSQSHRGDYLTLGTYLLTQLRVCVVFIKLMIIPIGLNADYDFPMSHSILELQTAGALLLLLLMSVSAYAWRHRCWYWSWCVALFFISLLSHIFPARYNVIAEHKVYLTMALLIPVIGIWLHAWLRGRFVIVCALLIACFAMLTIQRNEVWASPIRLWQDTCQRSPQKPRPHLNLASAMLQSGKVQEAEVLFFEMIKMAPEYVESYINLAQIETNRGNLDKALMYSDQAVLVNPSFDVANLQNGFLHDRMGHRDQAIKSFGVWLLTHPNDTFIINRIKYLQHRDAINGVSEIR